MAGILDFLNSDDARLGLGLMAAGGPTTDPNQTSFAQRLNLAMAQSDERRKQVLQQQLAQSQIQENASQNMYRAAQAQEMQRKAAFQAAFARRMGLGQDQQSAAQGAAQDTGMNPAQAATAVGGMPSNGGPAANPSTVSGMRPAPVSPGGMPGQGIVAGMSPDDVLLGKLAGIDATDIWKATRPNWQTTSTGYRYNANDPNAREGVMVGSTFMGPGNVMMQYGVDENGQIVATPIRGGMDTFRQQQRVSNEEQARYNLRDTQDASGATVPRSTLDIARQNALGGTATTGQLSTDASAPAGIRNNNPGNLRGVGQSTGFRQFDTPEQGLAALDADLRAKSDPARGLNTLNKLMAVYAPSGDNNNPARYAATVAQRLGITPDTPIDLSDPIQRQAIASQITIF